MLWYLDEALTLPQAQPLRVELEAAYDEIERLTDQAPTDLLATDLPTHRDRVNVLLARVSALVRADSPPKGQVRRSGAGDPTGSRPHRSAPRRTGPPGSEPRGAYLIGADLRRADLRGSDLIGADLRDADLSGADLSHALFLTQLQVNAARGDAATTLPAPLRRPSHWAA